MAASDVERIHKEFTELVQVLVDHKELSLQASADDSFRKVLLLSAASYFEHELTTIISAFVAEVTSSDGLIMALVQNKAISRQYHTWFNWNDKNANQFFALFGEGFKVHMVGLVKSSPGLDDSIRAFLEIGQQRNRLVHQNFASFALEKTSDEIFSMFRNALPFVDTVSKELRECSKRLNTSKGAI
jgi:hypothetical protein